MPELNAEAHGEADGLVEELMNAGDGLGFDVEIVDAESGTMALPRGSANVVTR